MASPAYMYAFLAGASHPNYWPVLPICSRACILADAVGSEAAGAQRHSGMKGGCSEDTSLPSSVLMAASDAVCRHLQTGLGHVPMLGSCLRRIEAQIMC